MHQTIVSQFKQALGAIVPWALYRHELQTLRGKPIVVYERTPRKTDAELMSDAGLKAV